MTLHFEVEITNNPVLGASTLWQFCRAYFDKGNQVDGPELPLALIVLPIAFHRRTARAIYRMQAASGMLKALYDHPELPAGLQRRLESFADLSLASLSIAIAASLIKLDRAEPWPRYLPAVKKLPSELGASTDDVAEIYAAAQRLGWWFAGQDLATICSRLHVRL